MLLRKVATYVCNHPMNLNALLLPIAAVTLILLCLQALRPLRRAKHEPNARMARNILFALPAFFVNRVLLLPIPFAVCNWAQMQHFGLFNRFNWPLALQVLVGVLALDYAYYWWHIATHRVPLLWRFHRIHHADEDMDVTTATRFHWAELLVSVLFRSATVWLLGIAPIAFLLYEVLFEIAGQFHHSNWRLNLNTESKLSRLFITPRLHGIHHSVERDETDSNWGTVFSLWDKWHQTRRDDVPQNEIVIGAPDLRHERDLSVWQLWTLPFRKP